MNPRLAWLSSIAADPRVSVHTSRFAVATAALADDRGRLRSRMTSMADACQIASRHMVTHIERLAELGYVKIEDLTRQGRFSIQIVTAPDDAAPAKEKSYFEIAGTLIATIDPPLPNGRSKSISLYVESDQAMTKVVIPRSDAEAIAAALAPAGAHAAPPALG